MRKKKSEQVKLTENLDQAVRDLFKLLYPNPVCIDCGKRSGWFHPQNNPRGMQVGHFVSRRFGSLRWDLRNVYPQLAGCNKNHNTNPAPMAEAIERVFPGRLRELKQVVLDAKGTTIRLSTKRAVLEGLKNKIQELTKELKILD